MNPAGIFNQFRTAVQGGAAGLGWNNPLLRALHVDEVIEIRNRAMRSGDPGAGRFYESALESLDLRWSAAENELARIPAQGPLVVVSNHPHGLADGLILGSMLSRVRRDVRFLANSLLAGLSPGGGVIPVNPFDENGAKVPENLGSVREALRWLQSGGALVVFPAGAVAALNLAQRDIREPGWKETAARLALKTDATVLPVRIEGTNGPAFHLAGLVHPGIRTALLPWELVNKRGRNIAVRIGLPVTPHRLRECDEESGATEYLQWRVQNLAPDRTSRPLRLASPARRAAIPSEANPATIESEIATLPASALLLEQGDWQVYLAQGCDIPVALREIGRLREIAFRAEVEGSGKPRDLDRFDRHYRHLFLWHPQRRQIGGAYRLAFTPDVLPVHGRAGLYANTLFRLAPDFFEKLGPAIELGRSFVRLECQREFAPLFLLWKGIGAVARRRPDLHVFYGAVSISAAYRPESRSLIAEFLKRRHWSPELASAVQAKRPWSAACRARVPAACERQLGEALHELEGDQKRVPILLRHYLNLGARALALHTDAAFSNVLDVLVAVHLDQVPEKAKSRYLGM